MCMGVFQSCQTTTARQISEYIGRPTFAPFCQSNGDGTCYRDGELEDNTNYACGDIDRDYKPVQDHMENVEYRLYICLKYPRRCK